MDSLLTEDLNDQPHDQTEHNKIAEYRKQTTSCNKNYNSSDHINCDNNAQ